MKYISVVLHGRQGLAPSFSYNAISARPSTWPKRRFFSAAHPETREGGFQALENHAIAVLPQLPAYEEDEAVGVLLWHSTRTRGTPQLPHAAASGVDMK